MGNDGQEVMRRIQESADYVQQRLLRKEYTVHRYESITTLSIYIKVDYGVGETIRISDHIGKINKNCKFNLDVTKLGKRKGVIDSIYGARTFYTLDNIDRMVNDIIKHRNNKVGNYGGIEKYLQAVNNAKENRNMSGGFWKYAIEVYRSPKSRIRKWLKKNGITYGDMDIVVESVRLTSPKIDLLAERGWEKLDEHTLNEIANLYYGDNTIN